MARRQFERHLPRQPITAALDAPYGVRPQLARMPVTEARLMMRPHCRGRITRAAFRPHSIEPVTLTAFTSIQCSIG